MNGPLTYTGRNQWQQRAMDAGVLAWEWKPLTEGAIPCIRSAVTIVENAERIDRPAPSGPNLPP